MRSIGKLLICALCSTVYLLAAGCGGISASKTVTPLDFILPGLLQSDPPPAQPDRASPIEAPVKQVAQN